MDDFLLHDTLARNAGVITLAQATAAGLSATMISDRVAAGRWHRVAPRTYLVAGHLWGDEARVRAAVTATAGTAHGRTAAWWHGMLDRPPGVIEVTVARARNPRAQRGVRIRRRDLDRRDRVGLRGLWVTDTALTVLEAAVMLPAGSTFLDRMLQTRVSFDALLRAHQRNPGRTGVKAAARLLAAASDRAGSDAERTLHRLLRRGGLTEFRVGYWVHGYEIDVAFPAAKVAVEVDGWAWHHEAERFRHDRARQNVLVGNGWRVLRYTWHQLHDEPQQVVAEIAGAVTATTIGKRP